MSSQRTKMSDYAQNSPTYRGSSPTVDEEVERMQKLSLSSKSSRKHDVRMEQKESRDSEEEESLLDIEQLEELHKEAERMKALGNKHMAAQEYTRAYNAYSAALQLSPVGPSSHVFLSNRAAALLSLKRYAAAATDARRAVALAPTFGKAHARLGQSLYFLKDYEGAVSAYEEAIRYEPENHVTITYLEKAKSKLAKQQEKASRAARGDDVTVEEATVADTIVNSVATDPHARAAVVTSGFRGSSAAIQKAVGTSPFDDLTKEALSPMLLEEEEEDDDDDGQDPDFDEALHIQERANHLLAHKQYKRAIEEYSAALFLVPDDPFLSPELHLGRAHALNGVRRHESARNDAQLALKWNATAEAYSTLAKSLFYLKDYQGSIDAFDNCMEVLPSGESLSMFDRLYLEKAEAALEAQETNENESETRSTQSPIPKLPPPRFVPREQAIKSTQNMPPTPKKWPQQSPRSAAALQCGPERDVVFLSESLGIKLNRGTDGIVRVIAVAHETPGSPVARKGEIHVGDVVREAAGVDIRRPITNIMWGDTVALIKLAPRPITFTVAEELSSPPPNVMGIEEQEVAEVAPSAVQRTPPIRSSRRDVAYMVPSPASGTESVRDSIAAADEKAAAAASRQNTVSDEEVGEETILYDDTVEFTVADSPVETQVLVNDSEEAAVDESQDNTNGAESSEPPELAPSVSEDTRPEAPPTSAEAIVRNESETSVTDAQDAEAESPKPNEIPSEGADEEFASLGAEIIFGQSVSQESGWTNTRWLSTAGARKLRHVGSVHRLVNGRKGFFWTGEQFVPRKLALFDYPNLILVLRAPKNIEELHALLDIPDGVKIAPDGKNTAMESFLVAESVINPKTCKLRLSPLTTITSAASGETSEDPSARRRSCFELVSPTETIALSAVNARNAKKDDSFADSVAFLETSLLEVAVGNALCAAHASVDEEEDDEIPLDAAWKHQIILGTLHSYVISGNQKMLEHAIKAGLAGKKADSGLGRDSRGAVSPQFLPPRVIDAIDESGRTALHYACNRRSHGVVALLVSAGANVSIPTKTPVKYPVHLSAENLDEKSLSTILSASLPSRPDPNALDEFGRTPMYVATMEGRRIGGDRDPEALGHCLSALEAWGGQMLLEDVSGSKPLRHPVSLTASEWRSQELAEILPHVPYRYPLKGMSGISLDASFHYPVHSAVASLRQELDRIRQGAGIKIDIDDSLLPESRLVSTLRVLLEHGFEPNERLQFVTNNFEGSVELSTYTGYAPLQILAVTALEIHNMIEEAKPGMKPDSPALNRISGLVKEAVVFLAQNGARLDLDRPPSSRSTSRSASSVSEKQSSKDDISDVDTTDRPAFEMETTKVFIAMFGGEDDLKRAKSRWSEVRTAAVTEDVTILDKPKSRLDSNAPGGSDEKSCAICWKAFGAILNRKHTCRVSYRYVCDDCSSKRIVRDGQEHRVSDGQFLVARVDEAKRRAGRLKDKREADRVRKMRAEKAIQERRSQLTKLAAEEDRESLFGGIMEKATKLVLGEEEETTEAQVSSLSESLGQTKDALNERGDRLNSLSEKTSRLKDASEDFAKMAKELERSQRGFW